ncbi:unnamed protein product [Urochloa decumbens]|uniref:Uncharacterized protein n=1 Tax=Urochloa decumbens TaxID=240449 RepID=A0ABC9AYV2_9POAL
MSIDWSIQSKGYLSIDWSIQRLRATVNRGNIMASGLVASVLSSASKLLDLLGGAPAAPRRGGRHSVSYADVLRLQRLLRRIQATLDDAGERELRDSSVKLWIAELTDVARDAEDVLDECRYELIRRRVQEIQGGSGASTSCNKRKKHDEDEEDRGICEQRIRKFTRRFNISIDRTALQLRPQENDGATSEEIVDITRWFEEISTDRNSPQLNPPEDEDGDISERIEDIRCQFEEISRDRAALQLRPEDGERITGSGSHWEPRATSHLLDKSGVFGRTMEKDRIIKSVICCSQCPGINVLPIVGMGGIGKTTLAQMVYNDHRVQESYDHLGWIHVSQTFDLRRLVIAVTESLTRQPCIYNQLSTIHDLLKENVSEKGVFLVLDDLWNIQQCRWQDFLCPLKFAQTVTILVTTRSKEVAHLVQTVPHFVLGSLPEGHCWQLFQSYAFGGRSIDKASSLVQVGKKVMQKCGGLPLAVKSIGCLLRSKMDMQTWTEISKSEFWEHSDDNEAIFSALRLSFYRLPARLKPCFLLCALYPKGEPFTKEDMIHLWIAHGYIQTTGSKTLEKVADEYFDELNERSLIETDSVRLDTRKGYKYLKKSRARSPVEISIGDEISNSSNDFYELHIRSLVGSFHQGTAESFLLFQRFRLHDMIWDLAKSLSSCTLSAIAVDEGSLYVQNEVRHLFFWLGRGRSRHNTLQDRPELTPISRRQLIYNRINNASGTDMESLGSSPQFGHWSESLYPMERRVNSVRSLTCLPTHKHEHILAMRNRASQLVKMNYLRTLVLKECTFYCIGIYEFTYLRALVLDSCKDRGCISATRYLKLLRYLHVSNCDSMVGKNLEQLTESICHLYSLEKLIVSTCLKEFSMKSCNLFSLRYLQLSVQFNDWSLHPFCQFYNLDTLCLQNCNGTAQLPICIGNLMNLRRLQLVQISRIKKLNHYCFKCHSDNNKCELKKVIFPALEELELDGLGDLQEWCKLQDSDYPKLQKVTIRNCYNLRRIPYFSSVRNLIVTNSALTDLQLSVYNEPSQLHFLDIKDCQDLKSLMGLKKLCSLGSLYIARCPKLIVFRTEKLPFRPQHALINDCPGLMEWCDEQELCYQVPKMVKISEIKRAKDYGIAYYFQSCEQICLDINPEQGPAELILSPDNWLPCELRLLKIGFESPNDVPSFYREFSTLGKLEIRGCPKLEALIDLEELKVHSLIIADCPLLYILPEMKFPLLLTSLVVEGTHSHWRPGVFEKTRKFGNTSLPPFGAPGNVASRSRVSYYFSLPKTEKMV